MSKAKRTAKSYLPKVGSKSKIWHQKVSFVVTGHSRAHGVEQQNTYDTTTYEGVVINADIARHWEKRNSYQLNLETGGGMVTPYKVLVTYLLVTLGPHTSTRHGYKPENCPQSRLFTIPLSDQIHPDWHKRSGWCVYTPT